MIRNSLMVGIGGFLGSVARYLVGLLIREFFPSRFPFGTLLVNVVGCFAIGFIYGLSQRQSTSPSPLVLFAVVGVLGGVTTFSAFGFETMSLIRSEQFAWAAVNVAANLVLGFAAVFFGAYIKS